MKLFLKISKRYDHDTSTSRTDGQTDRQTTCRSNTALCVASRGNKTPCSCCSENRTSRPKEDQE